MKSLKQIISVILFFAFIISTVFNILFILNKISAALLYSGFVILLFVVFLVSLLGIIIKNILKEERVSINIMTPVKELGRLYIYTAIIWGVTYFAVLIFK